MVWGQHFAFDTQCSLGRVSVRQDGQIAALKTMMAFAVIRRLDDTLFSRGNRLAGILAHRAATTGGYTADNQRGIACVGEMKRITHHLALKQRAKVMLFLVELDNSLLL